MATGNTTHEFPDELPSQSLPTPPAPRQRSPRTDPSMRDGDSSHGNPYEMEGSDIGTDNDTGDAEDEPVHAGVEGGESAGTTADLRGDRQATDFTLAPEVEEAAAAAEGGDNKRAEQGRSSPRQPRATRDSAAYNLPIDGYQRLTVDEITRKARSLSPGDLKRIRAFEEKHRNRKTLLTHLEEMMHPARSEKKSPSRHVGSKRK
jgi:hypothetical protein